MTKFIPGKKLSELYFKKAVKPILDENFPMLKYAAALIGHGSDVLGYDTKRSMDHDWGPRVLLFLSKKDYKSKISDALSRKLPYSFMGFSTNFGAPDEKGVRVVGGKHEGWVNHKIEIYTVDDYFKSYLNFDIRKKITPFDWLVFSEQKLLTIESGKVFHDGIGLNKIIKQFNYYPKDVWYYLLASQWVRISQEEHFMGRCGELKDEIGSKIIATRLVKDVMRLCFLMEKKYAPYIKWFGTAFNELKCSKYLLPRMKKVLQLNSWRAREKYLCEIYEYIAKMHSKLEITSPLDTKVSHFFDRPFYVIRAGRFAEAILEKIKDKKIKSIKLNIGSVNQFVDSTDLLENDASVLKGVYE